MATIVTAPSTLDKLSLLSQSSQYDISCSCGNASGHRTRSEDNRWLYPVTMPDGRKVTLLRTLLSNACSNTCGYCPLRAGSDTLRRCDLGVEELATLFMDYFRKGMVFGLFLSSGVAGHPDAVMERLLTVARILRKREKFYGYIHLKIIPGASDAALAEAVSLADAVSLNIEAPGEEHFARLGTGKDYLSEIIGPMKTLSSLVEAQRGRRRVQHTTQFVVGAAGESDRDIVRYTSGLYNRLALSRVFFSAYQSGLGAADLPGEAAPAAGADALTREHRLYQVDWLMRQYGFSAAEIPLDDTGNLDLAVDPKERWAVLHPERFPVNVNRASKEELMRVPGLGPTVARRIVDLRRKGTRLRSFADVGKVGPLARKAAPFVIFR